MPFKLAVAIPTFNRSHLLNEILWNICSQVDRYPDLCACYVIDNCSTDDTFDIVKMHQLKWKNLFYIKNKENVGLIRNISKAITIPDADWVWLLGDDDIPMPYAISVILEDLDKIDADNVAFMMMKGAKLDENKVLIYNPEQQQKFIKEPLTKFEKGVEIISVDGIHGIAWLSVLVINRHFWDQKEFEKKYNETDLYTFVTILLKVGLTKSSIFSNKLMVLATDRGSRAYYFSKTAIARVFEFPMIERMIVENYGIQRAKKLLQRERKGWLTTRMSFVIKLAVFKDAYSEQQHLLEKPLSPFLLERFLIISITKVCRISIINSFLKKLYLKYRGDKDINIESINKSA